MSGENMVINVEHLSRQYKVAYRDGDWIQSLFVRKYKSVYAVTDVSIEIAQGEIVGFLGPNGAGKSTVIKVLCGILLPTSGSVKVLGRNPFKSRRQNSCEIGVVFGQRSQLWWDLPIEDTFTLLKKIYKIPDVQYTRNLEIYNEYLDLKSIWKQPVRQLSLGQRMKAEIAASILHNPRILFLDEPTIGLDVVAKRQIRKFIRQMNEEKGTAVILTSHDTKDIEELCERIIIIDKGNMLLDTKLEYLQRRYNRVSSLYVTFYEPVKAPVMLNGTPIKRIDNGYTWEVIFDKEKQTYGSVVNALAAFGDVSDISILEKSVEDIIVDIYEHGIMI